MSKINVYVHTLNALIGCLCLALLGLVSHSISLDDSLEDRKPPNAKGTGMGMLFWPGVGGIVDTLLFLFLWIIAPSADGPITKRTVYANGLVFVATFIFIRPFIVLVYTFVEWDQAIRNRADPSSGYVTIESWACSLSDQSVGNVAANSLCIELRSARYLCVPILVVSVPLLLLVIWVRLVLSREKKAMREVPGSSAEPPMSGTIV